MFNNDIIKDTLFIFTDDYRRRDHRDGDNWHSSRIKSPLIICTSNEMKID